MNEAQENAKQQLIIKNNSYIDRLEKLADKLEEMYSKYDKFEDSFWNLMNDMERASANLPYLPYCNAYCIVNNNFHKATIPCIADSLTGMMNKGYVILSDEYMEETEKYILKNAQKLKSSLNEGAKELDNLVIEIIASNSITNRLSGLEGQCQKLREYSSTYWYPQKLSKNKYTITGSFVPPLSLMPNQIQTRNPFHRELMIKYEYLFKTKSMHLDIIKNIRGVLLYINEYIPFAELIPIKENQVPMIINTVSPKQVAMGSNNLMEGNIKIGNEGELNDGSTNRR